MILYQRVRPAIRARHTHILVGMTLTGSTQIVSQALTFWHQPWAMQLVAHHQSIDDPDSMLIDLVDGVLALAARYTFNRGVVRTAKIRKCIIYTCIWDSCGSTHRDQFCIPVVEPTGVSVGRPTARTHRDIAVGYHTARTYKDLCGSTHR